MLKKKKASGEPWYNFIFVKIFKKYVTNIYAYPHIHRKKPERINVQTITELPLGQSIWRLKGTEDTFLIIHF